MFPKAEGEIYYGRELHFNDVWRWRLANGWGQACPNEGPGVSEAAKVTNQIMPLKNQE